MNRKAVMRTHSPIRNAETPNVRDESRTNAPVRWIEPLGDDPRAFQDQDTAHHQTHACGDLPPPNKTKRGRSFYAIPPRRRRTARSASICGHLRTSAFLRIRQAEAGVLAQRRRGFSCNLGNLRISKTLIVSPAKPGDFLLDE